MKEDYLQHLLDMEKLCNKFKDSTLRDWFRDSRGYQEDRVNLEQKYFCFTPKYREGFDIIKGIVEICDMCGIKHLEKSKDKLVRCVQFLNDDTKVGQREKFEYYLDYIKRTFDVVKEEMKEKMSLLNPAEMDRLNEAVHCFIEGCYYSAVAMSVSAIEFRLFSLMMSTCPDSKLEELTLGQLIKEYLDNKQKYSNTIPKKHEPLLRHCNIYRVFSVHPKKEEINKSVATSILHMSFQFLLDKKLIQKVKT